MNVMRTSITKLKLNRGRPGWRPLSIGQIAKRGGNSNALDGFKSARCPVWVNRVDFATSALASAIHNTGHSHVRLDRSAWLLPAPELQTTGSTPDDGQISLIVFDQGSLWQPSSTS